MDKRLGKVAGLLFKIIWFRRKEGQLSIFVVKNAFAYSRKNSLESLLQTCKQSWSQKEDFPPLPSEESSESSYHRIFVSLH